MMGYPSTDFARHDTEMMAVDAAIKAEQEMTDVSDDDYADAREMLDTFDLVTVCFFNTHERGSPEWFMDVLKQCEIDQERLDDWANHIKNNRVERDFRGVGA